MSIDYYTKGTAHVDVYFPEDKVKCEHCDFLKSESSLRRFRCELTKREVYEPFAPGLPEFCPIEFTGEVTGIQKEG